LIASSQGQPIMPGSEQVQCPVRYDVKPERAQIRPKIDCREGMYITQALNWEALAAEVIWKIPAKPYLFQPASFASHITSSKLRKTDDR
jgi:hypothetical protein